MVEGIVKLDLASGRRGLLKLVVNGSNIVWFMRPSVAMSHLADCFSTEAVADWTDNVIVGKIIFQCSKLDEEETTNGLRSAYFKVSFFLKPKDCIRNYYGILHLLYPASVCSAQAFYWPTASYVLNLMKSQFFIVLHSLVKFCLLRIAQGSCV